jgi:polyvinyl alcohol dehydrogenase (cytochrome)
MDVKTGAIRWSRQVTTADNFVMGCGPSRQGANCPTPVGPDYDFGATPILFSPPHGRPVLLAGQKSGAVYGIDPDTGKQLWKTQVGNGSALGGVEWGMGADGKRLYVPISDIGLLFQELKTSPDTSGSLAPDQRAPKPGLYALDPASGRILWSTPAPKAACTYAANARGGKGPMPCMRAQSAAPAVLPGVVVSGTMDGWLRAYDSRNGKILWEDSTTARTYDTLNGIKGQPGGAIDGLGPTVAGGMVYVMSGFDGAARTGGNGVNVLLAYSVDGK